MRYLLISTCLLLVACGSYPEKQGFVKQEEVNNHISNLYFSNPDIDYVYKANIEVYDNNFGGIFIVKKLGERNHRIVFTTEMGNKLFDFSFIKDDFKVNFILDDLNKSILLNILKKDFKVLIEENLDVTNIYSSPDETIFETSLNKKKHYYYKKQELNKIIRVKGKKEKVRFFFSEISDNFAKKIQIEHSNIKLKINLKSIN